MENNIKPGRCYKFFENAYMYSCIVLVTAVSPDFLFGHVLMIGGPRNGEVIENTDSFAAVEDWAVSKYVEVPRPKALDKFIINS